MNRISLVLPLLMIPAYAVIAQDNFSYPEDWRSLTLDESEANTLRGYDCVEIGLIHLHDDIDYITEPQVKFRLLSLLRSASIPTSGETCATLSYTEIGFNPADIAVMKWEVYVSEDFTTRFGFPAWGHVWVYHGSMMSRSYSRRSEMSQSVREELAVAIDVFAARWFASRTE